MTGDKIMGWKKGEEGCFDFVGGKDQNGDEGGGWGGLEDQGLETRAAVVSDRGRKK